MNRFIGLLKEILWCWSVCRKKRIKFKIVFKDSCYAQCVYSMVNGKSLDFLIGMSLKEIYRGKGEFKRVFLHEYRHIQQQKAIKDHRETEKCLYLTLEKEYDATMFSKRFHKINKEPWIGDNLIKGYETYCKHLSRQYRQRECADHVSHAWKTLS